ncbi:ricin-type beta-trefoil lectin domain protein [Streptomyces decoyicus]|uniref:ricin-type beta-trefoil lectin domain protein n=1 Tax=Streptomyces decoyicus TaxID=249567 RepID=UPI002E17394A|nr:ricin-type beta-trefoil lectin domain protein [Streptomyces decoyicus]
MKRRTSLLIAGAAAVGMTAFTATSATAAPVPGFNIKNVAAKKCLKFNGFDKRVTAVKCRTSDPKQNWAPNPGEQIISTASSSTWGPCLTAHKPTGGYVYAKACNADGRKWSLSWSVGSFHDGDKTIYGNPVARCFLKVTGKGNVVCTPGHRTTHKWWVADYN